MEPRVDVIIAVHSETRPVARAVASVLENNSEPIRVTVVAHNIDPEKIIESLGLWSTDERVKILALRDEIHSPAGPFNFGLAHSTAPFFAVMGSDDTLEAGAIDSWLALQSKANAAMVIARMRHVGRRYDSSPPVRPLRSRSLDPIKDRLAYRSAPLGIISRESFGHLRFTVGLQSGEDLAFVAQIWFSGARIVFDCTGPAYEVHSDAEDRVTFTARPINEDFRFLDGIIDTTWFSALSDDAQNLNALKIIRIHVFDAILARVQHGEWSSVEQLALSKVMDRLIRVAPNVFALLSRIDREVLTVATAEMGHNSDSAAAELMRLLVRRQRYASLTTLLPRNIFLAMHRQAPLRTFAAGYTVMTRPPRTRRPQGAS